MTREEYYNKKAKYAYELYLAGKPFKKVYAAVKKGDKYVVLKNKTGKYEYAISGGGVDPGEDNITAIKREILEELNMNVEVARSLGVRHYQRTWRYEGREFDVDYEAEIFLTRFISYSNNSSFGLEGEFDKNVSIAEISKEEMLDTVYEFKVDGMKLGDED